MGLDQPFANGETQTQTAQLCSATLFESVENFRQRFGFNPQTGIGDFDSQSIAGIIVGTNRNLPISGCKLNCVIYQVPKDLLEPRRVGSQINFLCGEIESRGEMFSIDFRLTNLQSILQQRMGINNLETELDLALVDTCQIEQIVDEPRLQLHVATDHLQ